MLRILTFPIKRAGEKSHNGEHSPGREKNHDREKRTPKSSAKETRKGRENNKEEKRANSNDFLKNDKGFTWITFSLGEKHRITNRHIIRMLTSVGVGRKGIGRIDIKRDYTNIQLASSVAEKVVAATNGTMYKGRHLAALY